MKIIAVLNYKGGVGKTTFTVSTSQALALCGYRVLAIDNDNQRNLSLLLGEQSLYPTIQQVYRSSLGTAKKNLFEAIRRTAIQSLDVIPSHSTLQDSDVKDPTILKKIITFCSLERYYDFLLIDNSPGMGILQEASIHAAQEIFIPTELSYYALNGIVQMHEFVTARFPHHSSISRIIPNFFKNTKQQALYLSELQVRFPGKVTETVIPFDTIFDECMREGQSIFIHHLNARAAFFYVKLVCELFQMDEGLVMEQLQHRRKAFFVQRSPQQMLHSDEGFRRENDPASGQSAAGSHQRGDGLFVRNTPVSEETTPEDVNTYPRYITLH